MVTPKNRSAWLSCAVALSVLALVPAAMAQTGECSFAVDWRRLFTDAQIRAPFDADCVEGQSVITDPSSGYQSARLRCVAQLYSIAWTKTADSAESLFSEDPSRPMLVYSVVGADGRSALKHGYDGTDAERWVTRQSPHRDGNILVCAGARVWLEVADRPRLFMPRLTAEDTRRTDSTEVEIVDARFKAVLTPLGAPADVQLPAEGAVLEPWQRVVVGAAPPRIGPPDPPAKALDLGTPATAAGLGALLGYLLSRARGDRAPDPVPVEVTVPRAADTRQRRVRIRTLSR